MTIDSFIAVDLETTGLQPGKDFIIEIGALKFVKGECVNLFFLSKATGFYFKKNSGYYRN